MIMYWNRREVHVGFSIKDFNSVLDTLSLAKIKYAYRVKRLSASRNSVIGTAGENLDYSIMYYIYVHKKDVDIANKLLTGA